MKTDTGWELVPSSEIDAARKEIENLPGAVSRGEPLSRSEDVMILCGRLAGQPRNHPEPDDVRSWSEELADIPARRASEGPR